MSVKLPTVLFVDHDAEALSSILLKVEPVFNAYSLHTPGQLLRYLKHLNPDVIVLSDRLEFRKRDLSSLLATVREVFTGRVLILTECIDQAHLALWKERGADDCMLHPTRVRDRLDQMTRKIVELASASEDPGIEER